VTARATRIATLPVGYNDGLSYRLSNRGRALLRGAPAPIVGSISMDYTMLDVGHIKGVSVGDTATLVGADGELRIGIPELASLVGTIPYEIACSVGKRVVRVYEKPEREGVGAAAAAPGAGAASAAGRRKARGGRRAADRAADGEAAAGAA
jgi:alanine racemase